MASKVAEADAGIHSLAMAIAVGWVCLVSSRCLFRFAARDKLAIIR